MSGFLDLFGLRRRQEVRVRVNWLVDVRLAGIQSYVGFRAGDVSQSGVRLLAGSPGEFTRVISAEKTVELLVRVPGGAGAFAAEAEVKWIREEKGQAVLGCQFTRISREARRAVDEYVQAHPQDMVEEED